MIRRLVPITVIMLSYIRGLQYANVIVFSMRSLKSILKYMGKVYIMLGYCPNSPPILFMYGVGGTKRGYYYTSATYTKKQ